MQLLKHMPQQIENDTNGKRPNKQASMCVHLQLAKIFDKNILVGWRKQSYIITTRPIRLFFLWHGIAFPKTLQFNAIPNCLVDDIFVDWHLRHNCTAATNHKWYYESWKKITTEVRRNIVNFNKNQKPHKSVALHAALQSHYKCFKHNFNVKILKTDMICHDSRSWSLKLTLNSEHHSVFQFLCAQLVFWSMLPYIYRKMSNYKRIKFKLSLPLRQLSVYHLGNQKQNIAEKIIHRTLTLMSTMVLATLFTAVHR